MENCTLEYRYFYSSIMSKHICRPRKETSRSRKSPIRRSKGCVEVSTTRAWRTRAGYWTHLRYFHIERRSHTSLPAHQSERFLFLSFSFCAQVIPPPLSSKDNKFTKPLVIAPRLLRAWLRARGCRGAANYSSCDIQLLLVSTHSSRATRSTGSISERH